MTSISRAYEYIDGIPTEFRMEDEEERTQRLDNILNKNKELIEKMGEQLESEIKRMLKENNSENTDKNESKHNTPLPSLVTEEQPLNTERRTTPIFRRRATRRRRNATLKNTFIM